MSVNWNQIADQYFKYVDRNNDGVISHAELKSFFDFAATKGYKFDKDRFDECFKRADRNKDGVFTKQELVEFLKTL